MSEQRTWDDLPRGWLMSSLETARAHELKASVLDAVDWGFDQPEGLTNNGKRIRWLSDCREKAWTMLSQGADVPPPGKARPADEKPKRAAAVKRPPPSPVAPARPAVPAEVFPGKRHPRRSIPRLVAPDLCEVSARQVNDWLTTLPVPEPV